MEIINNGYGNDSGYGYAKIDRWNDKTIKKLSFHYKKIPHLGYLLLL